MTKWTTYLSLRALVSTAWHVSMIFDVLKITSNNVKDRLASVIPSWDKSHKFSGEFMCYMPVWCTTVLPLLQGLKELRKLVVCLRYSGEDVILISVRDPFTFRFYFFLPLVFFLSLSFCISIWLLEVIDQRDLTEFKGSLFRYAE